MIQMLCRNQVKNYAKWRKIFNADANAHRAAGLILRNVWRERKSSNTVYFAFDVTNMRKAKAFINAPDAKEQAKRSGVVDGEYHFLESASLYKPA
jgi:hypothetical protein